MEPFHFVVLLGEHLKLHQMHREHIDYIYIPRAPMTPQKQALFQPKQGPFGFQVYIYIYYFKVVFSFAAIFWGSTKIHADLRMLLLLFSVSYWGV